MLTKEKTPDGAPLAFLKSVPDTTECINWPYSYNKSGYGQLRIMNRPIVASRYALMLKTGVTPPRDLYACHTCHNRACVNTRHLYWGNCQDNVDDMVSDGTRLYGERTNRVKLKIDDVRQILHLVKDKGMTQRAVAQMYGLHQTTIHKIVKGKSWTVALTPRG